MLQKCIIKLSLSFQSIITVITSNCSNSIFSIRAPIISTDKELIFFSSQMWIYPFLFVLWFCSTKSRKFFPSRFPMVVSILLYILSLTNEVPHKCFFSIVSLSFPTLIQCKGTKMLIKTQTFASNKSPHTKHWMNSLNWKKKCLQVLNRTFV